MRVLCVLSKCNFGDPEHGLSHEYIEFYDTFIRMGHDVKLFDFAEVLMKHGKNSMKELLANDVELFKPDMMFTFLIKDEVSLETLLPFKGKFSPISVGGFGDDEWRFATWSRKYGQAFDWVVTTDSEAVEKYHREGIKAIHKRTGVNHHIFQQKGLPKTIDVSFVGGARLDRVKIINRLRKDGVNVSAMGAGWHTTIWDRIKSKLNLRLFSPINKIHKKFGETWISFEDMAEVFGRSKINLNFAASYRGKRKQIKGRVFDVTACGTFLLSEYLPEIEDYFILDKEIVCFEGYEDMAAKIKYYLAHETERETIAEAGYKRTMADHTAEMRMLQIFSEIGL